MLKKPIFFIMLLSLLYFKPSWADDLTGYRCTSDTFVEIIPGGQLKELPPERFEMRIGADEVRFDQGLYLRNYSEPVINLRSNDSFLAGRDYVRIAFDYPLLRLTFFNRSSVLVLLGICER